MSTVIPEGENLRKAIKWIDDAHQGSTDKPRIKLIDEAGMRFNLTPNDTEFLIRFYTKKE